MKTESMLSAGIDIGTTTTHLVISRIGIGVTEGFGTVPSVHITSKKVLFKSDVVFTPLLPDGKIDARAVTAIIKEQYKKAGVTPDELKCGAVIVTGESACRENASEVISSVSEFAGDFIAAQAGSELESYLSGKGAGADVISENEGKCTANVDIGGGTTNISVFVNGSCVETCCLNIGGRLVRKSNDDGVFISSSLLNLCRANGINIKSFDDLSKALLEKPDIAYITNITKSHIPCAIACAKAGCHLFLEKPISDSLDGIEELAKIVAEKKLKVFVGYQNRFHPGIQYLKQFLADGSIGRILSVRSVVGERLTTMHTYENYKDTYMARKDMGGGVLLNQMVHELDYLYYLFGQPKSVYALGGINGNLGIDVEDNLDAIYRYESEQGTFPVSVHADFYQYPPSRFVKVVGERGHIIVDLLKAEVTQAVGDEVTVIPYPDFARNDMFIEELKLFIDCIREDTEPAIPLADGIVSLKMALAARKSMETGGVIDEFTGTV